MTTFWDILWAIKWQFMLLAIGLFIGAIPTFKDMRTKDPSEKRPLNRIGWAVFGAYIFVFILSAKSLYDVKQEELENDYRTEANRKLDSTRISSMYKEVVALRKTDSTLHSAMKKGGYKLEGGRIIAPHINVQNVKKGGNGLQNNGTNFGIQNVGGNLYFINSNTKPMLTEEGKRFYLNEIIDKMKTYNVTKCEIALHPKANGDTILEQIKQMLKDHNIEVGTAGSFATTQPVNERIVYNHASSYDINNYKHVYYLQIIVGNF